MLLKGNFVVKENSKSAVEIEGLANAMIKDRIGDLIPKEAWELDEFKKNPIIFFNHDAKDIVGKAVGVEATDEGLKIRVRLSRSKEGKVPYVRDLVQEGILKAFSVGFNDHGSAEKDNDGTNIIKRAELLETSIVSVPMNQGSLFTVVSGGEKSGKRSYEKKALDAFDFENIENYQQMKETVLNQKGAWVAAAVHNAIYEAQKQGADRDVLLDAMLEGLEMSRDELDNVMAGNVTPVPEAVLARAAETLELDLESLQGLNAGDVEASKAQEEKPEIEEEEDKAEEPKLEDDEMEEEEEEKAEEDKPELEEEEEEKAEEEEKPKLEEEEEEEEDESEKAAEDFQACVAAKVPKLLEDGLERDEAIAQAISMCETSGKCSATPAMIKDAIIAANGPVEKEVSQPLDSDPSRAKEEFDQGQPSITLAKSQLALTGSLIEVQREILAEVRRLADAMTEKAAPEPEQEAEPVKDPEEDTEASEDEEKALKIMQITKDIEEITKSQRQLNKLLSM